MTTLALGTAAVADLYAARDYYEAAEDGLSRRLEEALSELSDRLEVFPRSAPLVAGYTDVRRAIIRGFPSVVFYRLRPDRIDVLRILHAARSDADRPTGPDLRGQRSRDSRERQSSMATGSVVAGQCERCRPFRADVHEFPATYRRGELHGERRVRVALAVLTTA